MTPTRREIPVDPKLCPWGGSALKLGPTLARLHNDGHLELPADVVVAAIHAAEIATAAEAARADVAALERTIGHELRSGRDGELERLAIIDAVVAEGPAALDRLDELHDARLRLPRLRERDGILQAARTRTDGAVRAAFLNTAATIAERLLEIVETNVARARPDALLLAAIDPDDAGAVAALDADGQAAAHRLAELAPIVDLARQSAIVFYLDLVGQAATARTGAREAADAVGLESFLAPRCGIQGPVPSLKNSAEWNHDWRWHPEGSALGRLVRAALVEPAADALATADALAVPTA